ncbi:uncharacterized protein LOC120421863 [Culex pipiens pallens]|uniref:uncharacterized protein LOC120421863 n=1 Tax=Culex pipiens pallens TaxID=42434 RepID=UPI0019535034|nr:uncharacterized protein LOC120421863 [Culex pipiens pallens]
MAQSTTKRYCIVGAGAGGLSCARHAADTGAHVTVFEQTASVGGTWVYTDETGHDRYGLPVHSSMYRDLRTNIPKQTMGYWDSELVSDRTYPGQEEVLSWLEGYAEQHRLSRWIKFEHQVIRIVPLFGEGASRRWEVIVRDLRENRCETLQFDFVMVCNGHYSCPMVPEYPGRDVFVGIQIHSHDYRCADRFEDQDVLLVGAGYSASDIAIATAKVARSLTVSHHDPNKVNFGNLPTLVTKPTISKLTPTGVEFVDGTAINCSVIIYCTGYRFTYPFLSVDCGITVEDNHVTPLYKHVININHPSMALIGVPFYCCPTQMMDLQARFCIQYFTGSRSLPSRSDMLADTEADLEERKRRGLPKKWMHKLVDDMQFKYYEDLARTAGIVPLEATVEKMFTECMRRRMLDVQNYRDDEFEVVGED